MPRRIKRVCRDRSCNQTHRNANGYCDDHKQSATGWSKWQEQKGNRHQRGYGNEWEQLRKIVIQRDSNLCQPCLRQGKLVESNAVDHIKPKAAGGSDNPHNLQCICDHCHKIKTAQE